MDESVFLMLGKGEFGKDTASRVLLSKGEEQKQLFQLAQKKRDEYFPSKKVEVRRVIELSNICQQDCNFCNINSYSKKKKYLIGFDTFLHQAEYVYNKSTKVLLLQSGENRSQSYVDFVSKCIASAKEKYNDLTIILCLGNLNYEKYKQLRESGADRYILKFETSNPVLYKQIKPGDSLNERLECINMLGELGYEVGSGNIIGLPNQTIEDIVNDLFFIEKLKLKMISTSVFIPGEESNYRSEQSGDLDITLNYMALMRIKYPRMLIPSTSSLEKARAGGQYLGLTAGANTVTIHDGTPVECKEFFPIYSVRRFTPAEDYVKEIVARANLIFNNVK